ncbi:hypothetical protein PspCFBP13508_02890 [Pseudomonas sp. CFBP13508]|nr:hypothetical protein PspCFBP13508_02890 [Pseudomonas sp. CFBP13508]
MGASLLAKAVFQSTSMVSVPTSSRAGSLPQGQQRGQTLSSRNSRSHELITRLKFSCSARLTAT